MATMIKISPESPPPVAVVCVVEEVPSLTGNLISMGVDLWSSCAVSRVFPLN